MKVLIDTNVLLDVLANRPGLADTSKKIWEMSEVSTIEGYISSLSIFIEHEEEIVDPRLAPEALGCQFAP